MIGKIIRQLRKENDITQANLAKAVGVTTSSIGMYETGVRKPSYEVIVKLANYFNVTTDYLLENKESKNTINIKKEFNPKLSIKEQERLDKQAEKLIDELTVSLSQNKDHLNDEDYEVLLASMKGALQAMTIRNKKKYTPKKYRNKK
ncbi:helix-turn-helix domain-containing protein [Clostridium kluyveri]|uniref:helix-turn-helix domain-containing protein n=1 Tax=Clostridium kluyveri TaxID=1534 RepID=UPI002246FD7B|nr:helix-turn-helix transcriptional regulator [Clostridium kluyveri]UZQ51626.1 helix-turn-helix domain-containing protein [Clostridium kluyveri]